MNRLILVGVLSLAGCAGGRLAPGEAFPRSPTLDDESFRPPREMAANGRLKPMVARQCRGDMRDAFDPKSEAYVAYTWRAMSEFCHFVATVVPLLLTSAEDNPGQADLKTKFMAARNLQFPGSEMGGLVKVEPKSLREGILVHETLYTSDLWMKDLGTGTSVYFDGKIEYGSADAPDLPEAAALVNGWGKAARTGPGEPQYVLGARIDELYFESMDAEDLPVEGTIHAACGKPMTVSIVVDLVNDCPPTPATVVETVTVSRKDGGFRLVQDEDPCDGCLLLHSNDAAEPRRICPGVWAAPGAVFTEAPGGSDP